MTADSIETLRQALGVSRPLRLAVSGPNQQQPRYVEVDFPFSIIGRGSGCGVQLSEQSVSFRHVYLQVFGDRVTCVDLLSPAGIEWDGVDTQGWLTPEHRVGVGPCWVQLFDDGWSRDFSDWPPPLECKTRNAPQSGFGKLPVVDLRLANRPLQGTSWPINRVMTLVGRDDRCRITCGDTRVSRVHCSLLLTPYGLWVLDLLGRGGIQVNETRCRFSLLREGDQLTIGQYRMNAAYSTQPQELPVKADVLPAALPDTAEEIPVLRPSSAADALPSPEFLTRTHRIFPIEIVGPTVIVRAKGGIRSAPYQDIQLESNTVTQIVSTRGFQHVIVDLQHADAVDSIVMNSVMGFCRAATGRAAVCQACDAMLRVLSEMKLTRLWPHFATREEALEYVRGKS